MSSNFTFLPPAFKDLAETSRKAEEQIMGDPRAACFHARFALEVAVRWLYRYDSTLRMPYDTTLGAMIHDPGFRNLLPEAVFQKARVIQQVGNQAVHESRPIRQYDALQVVKELHHLCYWLTRTYAPETSREGAAWSDARVPQPLASATVVPRKDLEALEKQLEAQAKEALQRQQEKDALDSEIQVLRAQLAEAKAAAEKKPDTHDYTEAETRHYLIDLELKRAGWLLDQKRDKEFEVTGMPNQSGKGYVDDVLWGDLRLRLRGLVQFIDKSKRKIVYTHFEDEIVEVRLGDAIAMPKMTGVQYAKKVEDYLRTHQDEIAIQRLRNNQPLTPTDLHSLEQTLRSIGEDEGEDLLTSMLALREVPTLAHLVRRIVGMDRNAAKAAFATFLADRSLSAQQMRFVELVIDQLTARGFMEPAALYEQPFSSLHADGPEGLFASKPNIIDGLFHTLEETLPRVVEG